MKIAKIPVLGSLRPFGIFRHPIYQVPDLSSYITRLAEIFTLLMRGTKRSRLNMRHSLNTVDFLRDGTQNGEVSESHPSTPGLASCLSEIMFGFWLKPWFPSRTWLCGLCTMCSPTKSILGFGAGFCGLYTGWDSDRSKSTLVHPSKDEWGRCRAGYVFYLISDAWRKSITVVTEFAIGETIWVSHSLPRYPCSLSVKAGFSSCCEGPTWTSRKGFPC
jgi:hypothetical protein